MQLLNEIQIRQKLDRLAYQILENNFGESEIIFAGINNNGYGFAQLLVEALAKISPAALTLTRISLNPAQPTTHPVEVEMPVNELEGKVIILVDDVANTGRSLYYALRPLMDVLPKKVEIAVLVDRKHKAFPVRADYVGLTLATTLKQNIDVKIRGVKKMEVNLD